jgi:hypothetical protein
MSPLQQASVRNRLLSALTPEDFWLLQPHLEPVSLGLRQWVIESAPQAQERKVRDELTDRAQAA